MIARLVVAATVLALAGASALSFGADRPAAGRPILDRVTPSEKRTPAPSAPANPGSPGSTVFVPVADPMPSSLPAEGTPPGWTLKEFAGRADVEIVRTDGQLAMRLRSDHSSYALYRDVAFRVEEFPMLSWTWKVVRLPRAGDVRVKYRDDQAAQLYVIFPRWPAPIQRSDVIGYVWDTTAPVDTRIPSPQAENIRIIVVDSGPAQAGVWRRYERNVAEDYAQLFGRKPPRVGKVAVMIDSNDTRSEAEAFVGPIAFRRWR